MKNYVQGTDVECSASYKSLETGQLLVPDECVFLTRAPDGTVTTSLLSEDEVTLRDDRYVGFVNADQAGTWNYQFSMLDGEGEETAVKRGWFRVKPSII